MSRDQTESDRLKAIRDLASEEIMSLSDAEIRARAKEELVDIDKNASTIQEFLKEKISSSRKYRMQQARKSLDAVNEKPTLYSVNESISDTDIKARLADLLASGVMANDPRLTPAFRNGEEMSEDDMRSLLEDYEE